MKQEKLLSVTNLAVEFTTAKGKLRAVSDVSFDIAAGETLGIVGESGCGKSVTSLAILGLIPTPHGKIVGGSIKFKGQELVGLSESRYRRLRGRDISMIFQEPMTALNPVFRISSQMIDVLCRHQNLNRKQARERAVAMLKAVGIPSPEKRLDDYPHQLSGGMRQRVMIAMALSCGPSLLLADEPTTALDVTTQAQVMYEINKMQRQEQMAMVLVTHDLGVVAESCQNVLVMYCGQVVEAASVQELFANPRHPYTKGLIESIPVVREKKLARLPTIEGMVPDLMDLPPGCRFVDRCERAIDRCRGVTPLLDANQGNSLVACYAPYDRNEPL